MRIRTSITSLVILFTLISCFCYGQGWATIDARLLMILHPRMGNFDYSAGRFFRQSFSAQRNAKLYEALNKATMETERNMAVLIRKEQALIDKRADLLIERDTTINDLAEKAASSTYIMKGKYERVAEYEKRYEKKMQALDAELEALYVQMENTREQAYSPCLFNKAGNNQSFN